MNMYHLITEIEKVDPEVYERLDARRQVFRHFAGFGKKLVGAALPLALGGLLQKAYGQSLGLSQQIRDVLNFALGLEYLEAYFYNLGLAAPGLKSGLTGQNRRDIEQVARDENAHVQFLRLVLGGAAIKDPGAGAFDFTGSKGGKRAALFPDVFSNYITFISVGYSLEDTGVRAYKGGAPLLMSNNTILEAALNIHSVEARHAAHLRTMRRGGPQVPPGDRSTMPEGWIPLRGGGGAAPGITDAIYGPGNPADQYPAEDNIIQAGLNIPQISYTSASDASAAFDEPLDMGTVQAIAANFIK